MNLYPTGSHCSSSKLAIKSDLYISHLFADPILVPYRVTIFGIDGESIFDGLRKFQTKLVQLLRVAAVDGGDNSISSL